MAPGLGGWPSSATDEEVEIDRHTMRYEAG